MVRLRHMSRTLGKRILRSETGQMAVFVALIFQVLFVFFAMVINIGLVVHDKINLQTAVDLGAYYGAQRQAEILNEIAHINYQIRQDYKLLTWRYRVMGTLGGRGAGGNSPALSASNVSYDDAAWRPGEIPSVCAANSNWLDFKRSSTLQENYCYQGYNQPQPLVPILQVVAPFIPGILAAQASSRFARTNQIQSCEAAAGLNWQLAMQMMYAYRLAVAGRKAQIFELRKRLVAAQMLDQAQQPVATGVLKTIKNNLTMSNASSFDEEQFQVYNGLSNEDCAGPDGTGETTLPEIYTTISLPFTNMVPRQCTLYQSVVSDYNSLPPNANLALIDPDQVLRSFANEMGTSTEQEKLLHSTLGFEKNPWCMAYVGVRARTSPRKPFAPFGRAIVMEARAFAQPFGGRVGPWYTNQWPAGSPTSNGGDRVDPLTTARTINNAPVAVSGSDLPYVPNYSRFPGDTLGLKSQAAIAATRNLLNAARATLNFGFYSVFDDLQLTGDPLVWTPPTVPATPATNGVPDSVLKLRDAEEIAVAPDVFDATYYSIDPQYFGNYMALSNSGTRFPNMPTIFGKQYTLMPDIGGRNTVPEIRGESVSSQIVKANAQLDSTLLISGKLAYPLKDWSHLLTGWSTDSAITFSFPNGKFGVCNAKAAPTVMVPGACAYGGRVGYSVRVISREHLLSASWSVGGPGGGAAAIRNPPPVDF